MTLAIAAVADWLVCNGWQKVDPDPHFAQVDGELLFSPRREQSWLLCEHTLGPFISVTPAYEVLPEHPNSSYNDAHLILRFNHSGVLEDAAFAETASGEQHAFAFTDAVAGLTPADLPALIKGLRSTYTELVRCVHKGEEFTQERLEAALQFDLQLFAIFDVPEMEEAS